MKLPPNSPQERRMRMRSRICSTQFPHQQPPKIPPIPTTIENIEHIVKEARITARYNVIKKELELLDEDGLPLNIDEILSLTSYHGMATQLALSFLSLIGMRNAYNPVVEWIESKPWDGRDRLTDLYQTVTPQESFPLDFRDTLIKRWVLSAVAAAYSSSGSRGRGVLTLQGRQGLGKTTWIRMLVSDLELASKVVKLDHHLDAGNKDSILGAIAHWIVEIGELDSSFKRDIARLKGFLTSDMDKLRPPYARTAEAFPRQTVFAASVNDSQFLIDPTGNSRFWTIPVEALNYQHDIDMQQLFAQVREMYQNGEQHWLTQQEEELLESLNDKHRAVSAIEDRIIDAIDFEAKGRGIAMTPIALLTTLGLRNPSNAQCKEAGAVLRGLFGPSKRINGKHKWRIALRSDVITAVPECNPKPKATPGPHIDEEDVF